MSKDSKTPTRASIIASQIPDTRRVGFYKDEKLDVVNEVVSQVRLDYVELNGHKSDDYLHYDWN